MIYNGKKKATTVLKKPRIGKYIEMGTVNGWCAGGEEGLGDRGDDFSVSGGDGERLLSKRSPTSSRKL